MAASPISACLAKYDALTFAGKPDRYFQDAPRSDGAQVRPPYVVISDEGATVRYDFEAVAWEVHRVRFDVYADTLAACDATLLGIKYDGQAFSARAGFELGTLALASPYAFKSCKRAGGTAEQRRQEGQRGLTGQRTFSGRLVYEVTVSVGG